MKNIMFLAIALSICISIAQVPTIIDYQGKLTGTTGIGVNGNLPMVFKIYSTPSGGTPLWTESHPSVLVAKGLFDVKLGKTTAINLPFDRQYWLEITVNSNVLVPRIELTTSPYAFRAKYADFAGPASYADSAGAVDWYRIRRMPSGFADGIDNVEDADHSITNELLEFLYYDVATETLWAFDGGYIIGTWIPRIATHVFWDSIINIPPDIANGDDGIRVVRSNANPWIVDSLTLISGSHIRLTQVGKSITIMAIFDTLRPSSGLISDTMVVAAQLKVLGSLIANDIAGQGNAYSASAVSHNISSVVTNVPLTSLVYSAYGSGSTILLNFDGVFDDRNGLLGATIIIELVRNPGPGEVIVSEIELFAFDQDFYQKIPVSFNGLDNPPSGIHNYQVRARAVNAPFTGGRFLRGKLILTEIKG